MSLVIFLFSSLVVVCTAGWPPMGGYGGSGSSNRPYPLYGHCQIEPNAAKMDANQAVDGMMVNGWVDIKQTSNVQSSIRISLSGLNPSSTHGFHIHQFGDLSNGCESAMSHYNPFDQMHGAPQDMIRHVGDLGNINSDGEGNVNVEMTDHQVMLAGQYAVFGRTVVVHEKADDLGLGGDEESKKTGNAGTRLACCVIGTSNGTSWDRNPAGVMATLLRRRNLERIWQN